MGDTEFARAVDSVGGRIAIGLKESSALQGVDDQGRSLASASTVVRAIEGLERMGVRVSYRFRTQPAVLATASGDLAARLRRENNIDFVEPDAFGTLSSQVTPIGVTMTTAPSGWALSTGSGVKVMVLDSGHDTTAVDLNVSVSMRCDTTVDPRSYDWRDGHGTHVMGIVAALNNTMDVVGMSYGVSLWSANVTKDYYVNNRRFTEVSFNDAACAIDVARINGIRVVNMSFSQKNGSSTVLTNAINGGFNYDNIVFVASAGNDTASSLNYPANLDNVIAVGATDSTYAHAVFSNTGSALDLVANGVKVLSTWMPNGDMLCSVGSGGRVATCSGTSMAAPHVAGAAALLAARYPTWTAAQIKSRLLETASDLGSSGFDNTYGYGFVTPTQRFA
jgi:subtilisin family serine protease